MNSKCKTYLFRLGVMMALCMALSIAMTAQVKSTTTTTEGAAVKQVTVERGEVAYVSGNDLIVKAQDGQMLHFPNVPEDARVTVAGKQLGIHDLQPGMILERTITVTRTPRMITTVETITGKVWHVAPPNTVILTLENGQNQSFKIPKGQKFTVDGQETDAFGLKKGMTVKATRIREVPETVVEQQRRVTGSMPPPPPALPPNTPILIAQNEPAPATTPAAPAALPKTGSVLPLIGLLGLLFTSSSLLLRIARR